MLKRRVISWLERLASDKRWVALSLLLILLASSWSLLRPGLFFVHDSLHVARATEMWQALSDGHWPPRWSSNFGFGYGIPLFEFYAPLPYYLSALLVGLGATPELIFKFLLIVPNFVTLYGTYLLGKKWYGDWVGVLMGAVVLLAPYRAVNLFVRGAVSESWGLMFFPVIILSGILVLERKRWAWLGLVLSLVGLILSHNLTTLLFVPFSLLFFFGYGLLKVERRQVFKRWLVMAGSYALAAALASYYMVPAFLEKNLVKIEVVTDAYYHFANHFVLWRQFIVPFWGYGASHELLSDGISFFLGYGFWFAAGCTVLLLLIAAFQHRWQVKKISDLLLWLWLMILSGLSLSLTTIRSNIIWEFISPLQFIQFPWRFLGIFSFFVGLSFGVVWNMISLRWVKILIGLTMVMAYFVGGALYFRREARLEDPSQYYFTDQARIAQELGPTLREYLPRSMPHDPSPNQGEVLKVETIGPYSVNVIKNLVQVKQVEVYSFQTAEVIWQTAAYPGWQVAVDGQGVSSSVDPVSGLITIPMERGKHLLELEWHGTPIRRLADTITLLSSIILIGLVVWEYSRFSKKSYGR